VNTANEVTQVGCCHAADKCQKTTNHSGFFELLALADSEAYQCTLLLLINIKLSQAASYYKFYTIFLVCISMTFVYLDI